MRSWIAPILAFAAFVTAQGSSTNVINNPPSGIEAKAGEPLTITWTNPSSGPVTIKIQTGSTTQPGDGIVVAENIANTGSYTFNVPSDVPAGQVYVQIVDEQDPSNSNFSGGFEVQGATNTASVAANTATVASASISESSASSASSVSESSASVSSSVSASESSASESSASAGSSSSISSESATARSSSSASATLASTSISNSTAASSRSSQTASRTSSASASAQSTTAPSNAAMPLPIQLPAGLLVVIFGAAAALL